MKVLTRRKETSMNKHLIVIYDNIQRILTLFSAYDHSLKPYVSIFTKYDKNSTYIIQTFNRN